MSQVAEVVLFAEIPEASPMATTMCIDSAATLQAQGILHEA